MTRIKLWNGDICVLEVDAIVSPANPTLWMSTGIAGALKRAGGDAIEFEAVRHAPVPTGSAVATSAGRLAASWIIHAVSLDRDRRTSREAIDAAVHAAMGTARAVGARSVAFPALGTDVGGFPLEDSAAVTVAAVRDEIERSPDLEQVVFALRGLAAYEAFEDALGAVAPDPGASDPDEVAVPVARIAREASSATDARIVPPAREMRPSEGGG